ncbi:GspH/FimT family pseudopilin [Acinetobacter colistiniresistens]|uniref:pilus assembly FimT family protein n=1 Tax=Acinetobacter TaxID=469 RepID=UPI0005C66F5B|nr:MULTISPECIES: GspH/FimT family pseudopilin [Acinetobacter]UUM28485.1 GspH/FimT family pseudopilin [Acinetobacter colistiniresistens]
MGKTRGFTLIELMVAIAVLGVIATMAVPSMSSLMEKRRYERNTRDLLSTLSQAKSQAILNRANVDAYLVASSSSTNNSRTLSWAVVNSNTTVTISPTPTSISVITTLPSTTTTTTSAFRFDSNGLVANITGDTTITLCNSKLLLQKTVVITRLGAYIIKPDIAVSACT